MAFALRMIARQPGFQSYRQPRLAVPVDHELAVLGPLVEGEVEENTDRTGVCRAGVGTLSAHEMTTGRVSHQQISPRKGQIVIYRPSIGPDLAPRRPSCYVGRQPPGVIWGISVESAQFASGICVSPANLSGVRVSCDSVPPLGSEFSLRQPHLAQGANSAWLIQPFQVDILPASRNSFDQR